MRPNRFISNLPDAKDLALNPDKFPIEIRLGISEDNHLRNVLRLGAGEAVVVVDRTTGIQFLGRIGESGAVVLEKSVEAALSGPRITALIGYPKTAVADSAVEKLTELGIDSLIFFQAARTQGKIPDRTERWQRVADAAIKQSGARAAAEIRILSDLKAALGPAGEPHKSLRLVCLAPVDLAEGADLGAARSSNPPILPILSLFQDSRELCLQKSRQFDEIYVLVGPEGGLSRIEIELLIGAGFTPVSLGRRTLRAETALILVFGLLAAWRSEQIYSF